MSETLRKAIMQRSEIQITCVKNKSQQNIKNILKMKHSKKSAHYIRKKKISPLH